MLYLAPIYTAVMAWVVLGEGLSGFHLWGLAPSIARHLSSDTPALTAGPDHHPLPCAGIMGFTETLS